MEKVLDLVKKASMLAGQKIMKYYKTKLIIKNKSANNPVTVADFESNKIIYEFLTDNYPEFGWLSEETRDTPKRLKKEFIWIVDPLDGTKEFIEGIPNFAVSIALVLNNKPIIGVLYNPATEELFYAQKDRGAFYNNDQIQCSKQSIINNIDIVVSRSEIKAGLWNKYNSTTKNRTEIGSVAYKLGLVAAGKYDFFATLKPKNEWDICAGQIILEEAGGFLMNITNMSIPIYNQKKTLKTPGLIGGNLNLCKSFSTIWLKNNIN